MRKLCIILALLTLPGFLGACSQAQLGAHVAKQLSPSARPQGYFKVGNPYRVMGQSYTPRESYDHVETGIASWYGPNFHGKPTANGEVFDKNELTAAHRTLQMPSLVRVTNLENGKSLVVRVNDRGPFKRGRVIDLSEKAAELLGFKHQGTAKVRVQVLDRESRAIAEAARRGVDTSGVEIALNKGQPFPQQAEYQTAALTPPPAEPQAPAHAPRAQPASGFESAAVKPVQQEALKPVTGHVENGRFLPDPVVSQVPVQPSSIFVQAGSFSVEDNAIAHAKRLARYGDARVYPVNLNGRTFYRVRLGPFQRVASADTALSRLASGNYGDAIIVVD